MLPDIHLDYETYEDIISAARNRIISLYPEWTDYNYHDPGITLIELFAWMKESQQYYMDQIGVQNKLKYLKLLGIRRRPKIPARTLSRMWVAEDLSVMAGMKFYAGDICFESIGRRYFAAGDIASCASLTRAGEWDFVGREQLQFGHSLRFYPFGREPEPGNAFYICFDRPVPPGEPIGIYLEIFNGYPVTRNRIAGGSCQPLAFISWEFYGENGWEKIPRPEDGTWGLLQDGFLRLAVPGHMERTAVQGREGRYIRGVLMEQEYDVPPRITAVSANVDEVIQRDTLAQYRDFPADRNSPVVLDTCLGITGGSRMFVGRGGAYYPWDEFEKEVDAQRGNAVLNIPWDRLPEDVEGIRVVSMEYEYSMFHVIGEGTGFPNQEFDLEDRELLYESLEILVRDAVDQEAYCRWNKVEDFGGSSPESRDYVFDSENGILRFGDCIRGMAPEGEILLISCARSRGSGGNIKAGKLNRLGLAANGVRLTNITDGAGGEDEESLEESFARARRAVRTCGCAVSDGDYEQRVKMTPGLMVESCRVVHEDRRQRFQRPDGGFSVHIVVKPYSLSGRGIVSRSYEKNILNFLEPCRQLGTEIAVLQPEYIEMSVFCEVVLKSQYSSFGGAVKARIEEFMSPYEREFGAAVSYGGLYGALDRMEAVRAVRRLAFDTKGNGVLHSAGGDIVLPPNGVLWLSQVKCSVSIEE